MNSMKMILSVIVFSISIAVGTTYANPLEQPYTVSILDERSRDSASSAGFRIEAGFGCLTVIKETLDNWNGLYAKADWSRFDNHIKTLEVTDAKHSVASKFYYYEIRNVAGKKDCAIPHPNNCIPILITRQVTGLHERAFSLTGGPNPIDDTPKLLCGTCWTPDVNSKTLAWPNTGAILEPYAEHLAELGEGETTTEQSETSGMSIRMKYTKAGAVRSLYCVPLSYTNFTLLYPKGEPIRFQVNKGQQISEPKPAIPGSAQTPSSVVAKKVTGGESNHSVLPPFSITLAGKNEVRIRNPNEFIVESGIRQGQHGINMEVPANGVTSVYIADGKYDIYFVYSTKPDALFQGDSFTLNNNGVEIQIVKVVDGNFNIRQVK